MERIIKEELFYFVRHGETDWNRQAIFMGQTDIPLNEQGIFQAHHAAQTIKNIAIESIISSPLQRAHQTACIIAAATNKPVHILDELREGMWGDLEGQPKGEGDQLRAWEMGIIKNAEPYEKFSNRIMRAIKCVLENYPGPTLIVAHGGVYRILYKQFNLPQYHPTNCDLIKIYQTKSDIKTWRHEIIQTNPSQHHEEQS